MALLKLIDSDTVLIGHSVDNDLHALKLCHGRCLDTCTLYSSARGAGHRPALRHLALAHLGRTIQTSAHGHSPVEDAAAALDLALLKVRLPPSLPPPPPHMHCQYHSSSRCG